MMVSNILHKHSTIVWIVITCLWIWVHPSLLQAQQTSVQVKCNVSQPYGDLPDEFRGTIYNVAWSVESGYVLQWVSQSQSGQMPIPIPSTLNGKVIWREISPDGRYLILEPVETGVPLVLWRVGTNDLILYPLSDDDIVYLRSTTHNTTRYEKLVKWVDRNHFILQYFDLDDTAFDYLVATKVFTIITEPFQLLEGERAEIPYPSVLFPEGYSNLSTMFSPKGSYLVAGSIGRNEDLSFGERLQIYSADGSNLLADFSSRTDRVVYQRPLWTPDESSFFLAYRMPPVPGALWNEMVQIHIAQGFQEDRSLMNSLQQAFGNDITLRYDGDSGVMSPSGRFFATHIQNRPQLQNYVVILELSTGTITAMCDDSFVSISNSYPVWSPDERFYGYWLNGGFGFFDVVTGSRYQIDGVGLVGWIDKN